MNKSDLVDAVASSADVTKASAGRAVDAVLESIGDSLGKGDSVSLVGFGTFSVRHRAAREGRNPQTGASMHIAASKVPGFKAGKGLKDKVKNNDPTVYSLLTDPQFKFPTNLPNGKYRNQFLNEGIVDTRKKIKSGIYVLTNLNLRSIDN